MSVKLDIGINTDEINYFEKMPLEIKKEAFLYLNIPTLNNVSNVCKNLSNIVND